MKLGFIGLGKMGSRMVLKLLQEGHEVVAWNRSKEPIEEFKNHSQSEHNSKIKNAKGALREQNVKIAETIEELVQSLERPRIVWVMVTAGAIEEILNEISKHVEPDDIVIDGGNSFYKDTEKRFEDYKNKGIRFLGIGVSGGIVAAEKGYPLMVGGDKSAYLGIRSLLQSLAKPHGGHEYFGTGGAGHFVKMIHNGIEYGIMQSLAEGFEVMEKAPYRFDLLKVAKLLQKGTLVSGYILDRIVDALHDDPKLSRIVGVVGSATDESVWAIEQAKKEGVPVEIMERSIEYRRRSQTDKTIQKSFTARLLAAMRYAFGGHEITKK